MYRVTLGTLLNFSVVTCRLEITLKDTSGGGCEAQMRD